MRKILFVMLITFLGSGVASAEDDSFECMQATIFKAYYAAGGAQALPAFSEPSEGGTRVQSQHPFTHLFGQTKYLEGQNGNFAICQYSNHVGLVAQYGQRVTQRLDLKSDDCSSTDCAKTFWRDEWMDSDPNSENLIAVCMETRKGENHPSTACAFKK
ncbi:hypothetical protein [Litorimonas sp. WD9-15]|uniref:hypothetical protein n=1 Tax=Litorimonas sp. WD9-15 TaxID=3418716 RepID=UPI003CFF4C8E